MFNLFKKSDKPKVDAAEIERREREERKQELAKKLKEEVATEKQAGHK
jgi:hypothetical protein